MKKQVEAWLKVAEIDLQSANKLLEEKGLTRSAIFHCHQALEKSFKAIMEDSGLRIPRIHDLEKLLGIIEENSIKLKIDEDIIDQINDAYIDTRYPTDHGLISDGLPSLGKANLFYQTANEVFLQIKHLLSKT